MIDITIKSTPINNPASAYILGKVTADLKAFETIESSDIVKSLFGIKMANPTAIDITQSIVDCLESKDDKTRLRSILQDRGHSGVIWRFTSTKKFMLELSKNIASSGNYLSLNLIYMSNNPEVVVREVVRFNKDGVSFLDKRNKSVEMRPSLYDDLQKIHEEAVANLEKKLLEPGKTPEPTPPPPKEMTMEEKRARFGLELFDKTLSHPCVFVSKGQRVFFIRGESGTIYLHDYVNSMRICALHGDQFVLAFGEASDQGVVFDVKEDIDDFDEQDLMHVIPVDLQRCFIDNLKAALYADYVNHDTAEPEKAPEEPPKEETHPPEEPKESKCIGIEGDAAYFLNLGKGVVQFRTVPYDDTTERSIKTELTDPNFDETFKYGKYKVRIALHEDDLKFEQLSDFMDHFEFVQKFVHWNGEPFTFKAGSRFYASKWSQMELTKESRTDVVRLEIPTDLKGISDLLYFDDPMFEHDFKYGKYIVEKDVTIMFSTHDHLVEVMKNSRYVEETVVPATPPKEAIESSTVTVDISKEELPASERAAHPEGVKIDLDVQITPGNPEIKITGGTVTDKATVGIDFAAPGDTGETVTVPVQQPTNTEENPVDIKIIIDEPFKDASESIVAALKKIYMANPEENMLDYTVKMRKVTELDNICVHHNDDNYLIDDKPEPGWFPQEEIPTADINDPTVQANLLAGLFGTSNPAITHLQKFLKNHLTEEQNAGFLATGTFPTETVIVWNEKPYDLTVSIVKFKDGRFYRCFVAKTNPGLTDHSFIATKDIPDRWVRLGADIQDRNEYRTDYRGRR